jgi:hypothetical protein
MLKRSVLAGTEVDLVFLRSSLTSSFRAARPRSSPTAGQPPTTGPVPLRSRGHRGGPSTARLPACSPADVKSTSMLFSFATRAKRHLLRRETHACWRPDSDCPCRQAWQGLSPTLGLRCREPTQGVHDRYCWLAREATSGSVHRPCSIAGAGYVCTSGQQRHTSDRPTCGRQEPAARRC